MTCSEFDRWLDEGRAKRDQARMTLHAAGCSRCQREADVAAEVERLLGVVVPAVVSAGLNDAVMRRIHARAVLSVFVEVMAEPLVPMAVAIASVAAWQYELVSSGVHDVAVAIGRLLSDSGGMTIGVAVTLAPVTAWISWRLFRAFERLPYCVYTRRVR
jgi:hypothetical protein